MINITILVLKYDYFFILMILEMFACFAIGVSLVKANITNFLLLLFGVIILSQVSLYIYAAFWYIPLGYLYGSTIYYK